MEGTEVLLASITTNIRVAVIKVTVPFATVLHALLVVAANATANTINKYSMSHTTLALLLMSDSSNLNPDEWHELQSMRLVHVVRKSI